MNDRSQLQNEVATALVETRAVDLGQVGKVFADFGERAALEGEQFGAIINWRLLDLCIPVTLEYERLLNVLTVALEHGGFQTPRTNTGAGQG